MPAQSAEEPVRRQRTDQRWARVRPALIVGTAVWAIAWTAALVVALTTSWPAPGGVPTAEQVHLARLKAQVSGLVGVSLPAVGLALALWCRREVATMLLLGSALLAVLVTRLLYGLVG